MRDLSALPKAHLHVHLESAVRPATLADICAENGLDTPLKTQDRFDGFRAFADYNALVRECLRRPEDFRRVAREFCEDEAGAGTRYAEVTFTAAAHGERVGDLDMPLEAVLEGLAEGGRAYGIECRVILDHSRRRLADRAWRTLELARRYSASGVVGIGLAGDESHPLAPFAAVCEAAREAGLALVHHAGEMGGAESIREALTLGGAQRIGHGIRVLDDEPLTKEVAELGVPLEVCPSSNEALGLVRSFRTHPLPGLRDAGLVVTLNTDIPSIAGTSLDEEFRRVREAFGYGDADLAGFARAAVDASFAPESTKARLRRDIDAWLAGPAPTSV